MIFVLALFSLPGTPVYDGVRLFLMVFPIWAIWVGIGTSGFAVGDHYSPVRDRTILTRSEARKKGTGSEPTSENPAKDAGREVPVPFFRGPRRHSGWR